MDEKKKRDPNELLVEMMDMSSAELEYIYKELLGIIESTKKIEVLKEKLFGKK